MTIAIRPARVADIPHLAYALMAASGGLVEALYEDAIPGRSPALTVEHLFSRANATTAYTNCWVAEADGQVAGVIHAFPMDDMGSGPADLLEREDRLYLLAPFEELHAEGSFYVMAVAVYPDFRGSGIARALMAEAETAAKAKGFQIMSLHVFAENEVAVRLYEKLGYRVQARQPVVPHETLRYDGDFLLMTRGL